MKVAPTVPLVSRTIAEIGADRLTVEGLQSMLSGAPPGALVATSGRGGEVWVEEPAICFKRKCQDPAPYLVHDRTGESSLYSCKSHVGQACEEATQVTARRMHEEQLRKVGEESYTGDGKGRIDLYVTVDFQWKSRRGDR